MQTCWICHLSVLLSLAVAVTTSGHSSPEFLTRTTAVNGETYIYKVYVPKNWSADREWPVILFLHGAGERGDDGVLQTQVGLGPAISQFPDRFPAVVVMPQCRRNVWWNDSDQESQVMQALDSAMREFKGDPRRIYLTGLSMGGYGSFYFGAKYPNRFAALVPVCGGIVPPRRGRDDEGQAPYLEAARRIGRTPIWIFHGDADSRVPVGESRKMRDALQSVGGIVRYTEYPGVGHNSWDRAYGEAELMSWLLQQRLP